MALIIKKVMNTGIVAEDSYCKVEEINANKDSMNFYLGIYLNKVARNSNKSPLETILYTCNHDINTNKNSIKQAYEYLKTLEEYKNAIDDLE